MVVKEKIRRSAYAAILLFWYVCMASAQEQKLFTTLSVQSGMPHSEVTAITADPAGFLWFGTYNGLARYDGYAIRTISKDEEDGTFKSMRVTALYCDPASMMLYIGTEDEGLRIMDLRTEKIVSRLYFANTVFSIRKGIGDHLWIGTERGVAAMDLSGEDFGYRYVENSLSKVYDILEIDDGILLSASESGISKVDPASGKTEHVLPGPFSRAVCRIDDTKFLLGTSDGLFVYDDMSGTIEKLYDIDVYCIYKTIAGEYWVGSLSSGIYKFDKTLSECRRFDRAKTDDGGSCLPNSGVRVFYEDFSGNLWIGTQNGASRYDHRAAVFEYYSDVLEGGNAASKGNKTASFYEDSHGRLWVGMYSSGLKILERRSGEVTSIGMERLPSLHNATISCFYKDDRGDLWIGTWDGLYVMPGKYVDSVTDSGPIPLNDIGKKTGLSGTTVFKVVQDDDGIFWLSTNDGLYSLVRNGGGERHGEYSIVKYLSSVETTDIYVEKASTGGKVVWTGTRHGLRKLYFPPDGGAPIDLKLGDERKNCISTGFISVIYRDSADRIWVLCLDGYIGLLTGGRDSDEIPQFRILDVNMNGSYDTAESLQEDAEGNFWIGGIRLIKFNPETWTIKYYDEGAGLYNSSFKIWSSYKLTSGELVFGSVNGITVFNPESLVKNIIAPKIALEDIALNGKRVCVGMKLSKKTMMDKTLNYMHDIVLPYKSNNISVSFAVLHYTAPEKNSFRYRMEGYDSQWTESSGRHPANYSNLPPGTYVFSVEGGNCDDVWSVVRKSVQIRILPPIWFSWPAIILYVLSFFTAVYGIRKMMLRKEASAREKEMTERKLKYFTDISHEIRTPLALISAPVSELLADTTLDTKTLGRLNLIRRNVARLTDLIEQVMDVSRLQSKTMQLKLSEQDIINVCLTAMSYFEDQAAGRNISMDFECAIPSLPVIMDRDRIEKVLCNIISNSFKYTPSGGYINITCVKRQDDVLLCITDSGSGISKEDMAHVFDRFYTGDKSGAGTGIGLSLVKAVVEQHKGRVWVESEEGCGTSVYFTLLLGNSHFEDEKIGCDTDFHGVYRPELYDGEDSATDKASVLVVEDSDEMRLYLQDALSMHFDVTSCPDGITAYDTALKNNFDCIVSDIMMPGMDGVEFCSRAKNDIMLSHVPIILLTAKGSTDDKIAAFEAGADDFISKPFEVPLLIARIDNLIKQRSSLKSMFNDHISVTPSMVSITPVDERFMQMCLQYVEQNISDPAYNVENLCRDLSMSRPAVYKKIKFLTGLSVVAFIRSIRLKRAAQLLSQDGSSIKNIMYMVGFDNSSYFSACFKKEFGCTPNEYVSRKKY